MPGERLFLEHVHPTRAGVTLLARGFYEALAAARFLGRRAEPSRLRGWDVYHSGTTLSPFDERVAFHTVETLTERWPFVPVAQQRDYRARYRPTDLVDSLAFAVSRGALRWEEAKLRVAAYYSEHSFTDSAVAEYAGLVRDQPLAELPRRMMAAALARSGSADSAERTLRQALEVEPTSAGALALGRVLVERKDVAGAIRSSSARSRWTGITSRAVPALARLRARPRYRAGPRDRTPARPSRSSISRLERLDGGDRPRVRAELDSARSRPDCARSHPVAPGRAPVAPRSRPVAPRRAALSRPLSRAARAEPRPALSRAEPRRCRPTHRRRFPFGSVGVS